MSGAFIYCTAYREENSLTAQFARGTKAVQIRLLKRERVLCTLFIKKGRKMYMEFSRVEVITSMSKLSSLKQALSKIGVSGMTVAQVIGCGVQNGTYEFEAEKNEEMELLPKQMIILYVENEALDHVVDVIKKELYTGHIGDGKIFISPLSNIIRVRTGEEGMDALK